MVSFFSGRDNPQFIFKKNQELAALMVEARDKSWFGLPAQMPFRLGYRGILVEDKRTKFAGLLVGPESADLQLELLKRVQLKAGDRKEIENDIKKINFEEAPKIKVRGKRYAPSYRPYDWNAFQPLYRRQRCNSCYDYVNLNPTDKRSEPGIGGGRGYRVNAAGGAIDNPYTADNIRDAALRDRLLVLNPHPAPGDDVPRPPRDAFRHLVALVVRPGM